MRTSYRLRSLVAVACLGLAACIGLGVDDALAQDKKAIRINHAGADDIVWHRASDVLLGVRQLRQQQVADARS